jgi:hypothetical protein
LGVSTLPALPRAGDDGAICIMFLLEGIVKACLHHVCRWAGFLDENPLCFANDDGV